MKLQRVQRAVANLLHGEKKKDHVTPLLKQLIYFPGYQHRVCRILLIQILQDGNNIMIYYFCMFGQRMFGNAVYNQFFRMRVTLDDDIKQNI